MNAWLRSRYALRSCWLLAYCPDIPECTEPPTRTNTWNQSTSIAGSVQTAVDINRCVCCVYTRVPLNVTLTQELKRCADCGRGQVRIRRNLLRVAADADGRRLTRPKVVTYAYSLCVLNERTSTFESTSRSVVLISRLHNSWHLLGLLLSHWSFFSRWQNRVHSWHCCC